MARERPCLQASRHGGNSIEVSWSISVPSLARTDLRPPGPCSPTLTTTPTGIQRGFWALIKATFASPIPQIPPVVRFAVATRSLRFFYTTNFDEVLFEAAAGDNVATYPDYVPMDARFVYLHGRASSANSVHGELVLGSSGYDLAYNATVGGWARTQLYVLAPYTVIFIGFSMADRSVARSLEEITRAARYRREIASDGEATEVVSPLSWYILLKAPTRTDPGRNEEKRSRETYLRGLGLRVVWYQDGGNPDPYSGLLEVVQRIE